MTFFRSARALIAAVLSGAAALALPLTATRQGATDLAFSGQFEAVPKAEKRFVSHAALEALPAVTTMRERPMPPMKEAELTVLPLEALLAELPLAPGADGIALRCADQWVSFYTLDFIRKYKPYVLLRHDGKRPEEGWPLLMGREPLTPYFLNVPAAVAKVLTGGGEYGNFDPTQVVELEAVNTAEFFAPYYAGALAKLEGPAAAGRKIFLRQCFACHQGPGGVGGNVSQRPLAVLRIHATLNADYFRAFVKNPKKFMPETMMPKHENFTPEMFDQLIAFLGATEGG